MEIIVIVFIIINIIIFIIMIILIIIYDTISTYERILKLSSMIFS